MYVLPGYLPRIFTNVQCSVESKFEFPFSWGLLPCFNRGCLGICSLMKWSLRIKQIVAE